MASQSPLSRRLPPALLVAGALLLAGCTSLPADANDPAPGDGPSSPVPPEAFHESYPASPGNLNVVAGGLTLRHAFALDGPAVLLANVAWGHPEPVVDLQITRDGAVILAKRVPVPSGNTLQEELLLDPGKYEIAATLYGVGALKDFTLRGSFSAP